MRKSIFSTEGELADTWQYETSEPRFCAAVIDGLLLAPFLLLAHFAFRFFHAIPNEVALLLFATGVLAWYPYSILTHARWGRTLGKRLCKVRVEKLDGKPMEFRHALMRDLPALLVSLAAVSACVMPIWSGEDPRQSEQLARITSIAFYLPWAWLFFDWVTTRFHPRRRSVPDLMAGVQALRPAEEREHGGRLGILVTAGVMGAYAIAWGQWSPLMVPPYTVNVGAFEYHGQSAGSGWGAPYQIEIEFLANRGQGVPQLDYVFDTIETLEGESLLSGPLHTNERSRGIGRTSYSRGSGGHTVGFALHGNSDSAGTVIVKGRVDLKQDATNGSVRWSDVNPVQGQRLEGSGVELLNVGVFPALDHPGRTVVFETQSPTWDLLSMTVDDPRYTPPAAVDQEEDLFDSEIAWHRMEDERYQFEVEIPSSTGPVSFILGYEPRALVASYPFAATRYAIEMDDFGMAITGPVPPAFMGLEREDGRRPTDALWGTPLPAEEKAAVILRAIVPPDVSNTTQMEIGVEPVCDMPVIAADMSIHDLRTNPGRDLLAAPPYLSDYYTYGSLDGNWRAPGIFCTCGCGDTQQTCREATPWETRPHFEYYTYPRLLRTETELRIAGSVRLGFGADLVTSSTEASGIEVNDSWRFGEAELVLTSIEEERLRFRCRGNLGLLRELELRDADGAVIARETNHGHLFESIEDSWLMALESELEPGSVRVLSATWYETAYYRDLPFEMTVPLYEFTEDPVAAVIVPATAEMPLDYLAVR